MGEVANAIEINKNTTDSLTELLSFFESKGLDKDEFNDFYEELDKSKQKEVLDYFNSMRNNENLLTFLWDEWFMLIVDDFNLLKNKFPIKNNNWLEKHKIDLEGDKKAIYILRKLYEEDYKDFFEWSGLDNIKDDGTFLKAIIEFLQSSENWITKYEELLKLSEKKWEQEFTRVSNILLSLSKNPSFTFPWLEERVDRTKLKFFSNKKNPYYWNENIIPLWVIIDWKSKIKTDWDTIIYWDQKVDFSEKPPVKYIVWENWFEIKSWQLDFKFDKSSKKEIAKFEKEFRQNQQKITEINWEITWLELQRNNLENLDLQNQDVLDSIRWNFQNSTKINAKIDEILWVNVTTQIEWTNNWTELDRLETELKEIIISYINEKISALTSTRNEIKARNSELGDITSALKEKEREKLKKYGERVKSNDERARKITSIYTDLLGDSINNTYFKEIISRISPSNPIYLSGWKIITWINLETFEITWSWLQIIDKSEYTGSLNKKYLAETMNVILSWNPKYPINLDSMDNTNTTFVDESWNNISRAIFISKIKESLSSQPIAVMINNIEKAKNIIWGQI